MKAKFIVSARLKAGKEQTRVEEPVTPMLMLAKFSGMNLSDDLKGLVASAEERVTDELAKHGFKGEAGEHLTITLGDKSKQKKVLIVGLGKAGRFDCGTVRDTIKLAVNRAVAARCERLTIPIMPNRLTSSSIGLMPTAYIIKCVAEDVLGAKDSEATLEIELLTSAHGKRHVNAGLAKQRRSKAPCNVCDDGEAGAKTAKPAAAKKDACRK